MADKVSDLELAMKAVDAKEARIETTRADPFGIASPQGTTVPKPWDAGRTPPATAPAQHQYPSAAQPWLRNITMMQQSVLFSAIRGPDGFRKHHPAKLLLKWYRRCILMSAFDNVILADPMSPGGGSFTGPSLMSSMIDGEAVYMVEGGSKVQSRSWAVAIQPAVDSFVHARDEMTLHYYAHAMHAFEIIGYKHPDLAIRAFWNVVYKRMCNALHMQPETEQEMDRRLGDDQSEWSKLADDDGSCSE